MYLLLPCGNGRRVFKGAAIPYATLLCTNRPVVSNDIYTIRIIIFHPGGYSFMLSTMVEAAFEHIGINVADKEKAVEWYVRNLGLKVVRDVPGKMAFLSDAKGILILEIYSNDGADRLDFPTTDPLSVHLAFEVNDPKEAVHTLLEAGATIHDPLKEAGDDILVMLRDPFGLAFQLVKRGKPMRRGVTSSS